jgi:hypothetical protein
MTPEGRSMDRKESVRRPFSVAGLPLEAVGFLVLTVIVALLWSHVHLLWADEFCALYTDRLPSLRAVAHYQATTPMTLDPMVYNSLAHFAMKVLGPTPFALRLPSLFGFVLMQVCLFYFVRPIAGERVATLALGLPALLGTSAYAMQARPYAMLMGLSALAMVTWQRASRKEGERVGTLVALAVSIALAINTHYYGVLLLVPLCAAELVRSIDRKRIDGPMILAIAAGAMGILLLLPFTKAAGRFSAHYYESGKLSYHFITHTFLWLVLGYVNLSGRMQLLITLTLVVAVLGLLAGFVRAGSWRKIDLPWGEAALVVTMAALPVSGLVLAILVTHVVEGRYVIPAVVGVVAGIAILATPVMGREMNARILLAVLFVAIVVVGGFRIHDERLQAKATLHFLELSPEVRARLDAMPDQKIHFINPTTFFLANYYMPYPELRGRMELMYWEDLDMEFAHSNYQTLSALGVSNALPGKAVDFRTLIGQGGGEIFLLPVGYPDWTEAVLKRTHAVVSDIGPGFEGELVEARYNP